MSEREAVEPTGERVPVEPTGERVPMDAMSSGEVRQETMVVNMGPQHPSTTALFGGGGRESNPLGSSRPHTGFEDRGAHQAP